MPMLPMRHVLICNAGKACLERDSAGVYERFRKLYKESGLKPNVLVTGCGSVGFCDRGVAVLVYPEQVWYSRVTVADVDEIWHEHVLNGRVVARLRDELEPEGPGKCPAPFCG
jgi:NADP-reducing hydrogenase subunit HndC